MKRLFCGGGFVVRMCLFSRAKVGVKSSDGGRNLIGRRTESDWVAYGI